MIFLPVFANCLGEAFTSGPTVESPGFYLAQFGGELSVYERILAMTDCAILQEEFDIARAKTEKAEPATEEFRQNSGYMTAADARMHGLGCFSSVPAP